MHTHIMEDRNTCIFMNKALCTHNCESVNEESLFGITVYYRLESA
jgi:hypothetical protein